MNKYWSKTFQDTVGRTVNGLSDSAAKLKQNWNERPLSLDTSSAISSPDPNPSPPDKAGQEKTQYLRLPVESARKLRWFDREDIDSLVEASARDKKLLHATISALRQKLQDAGIGHADLDEDLDRQLKDVSSLAEHDEAVSSVLLVSLQEEVRLFRDQFQAVKTRSPEPMSRSEQVEARHADDQTVQLQIVVRANEVPAPNKESSITPNHSPSQIAQNEPSPEDASFSSGGEKENEVMDALLGKLRRLEEERREYYEEMVRLTELVQFQDSAAKNTGQQVNELQAELERVRTDFSAQLDTASRKGEELRERMANSQDRHAEILRRAQDICLESEERASTFEKRAVHAEARVLELQTLKDRLEARASQAEAQLNKHRTAANGDGPMRTANSEEKIQTDGSEKEVLRLQRLLQAYQSEINMLETRLSAAEKTESIMAQDLQANELALAERAQLEAQLSALREQMEENRSEQERLSNYKQLTRSLEEDKVRLEDEVLATVQIASKLEARLQTANSARSAAEGQAISAEARARDAEQRVEKEVARRLELIGADETLWPSAAKQALSRQSMKLESMRNLVASLQNELDSEHSVSAELQSKTKDLQAQLRTVESSLQKEESEFRETRRQLESKINTLQTEVRDWQRELAHTESELGSARAPTKASNNSDMSIRRLHKPSITPSKRGGGGLAHELSDTSQNGPTDLIYLKNVLVKFILSASSGNTAQCQALLPAVATLLHANSQEFRALKNAVTGSSAWWSQVS